MACRVMLYMVPGRENEIKLKLDKAPYVMFTVYLRSKDLDLEKLLKFEMIIILFRMNIRFTYSNIHKVIRIRYNIRLVSLFCRTVVM